MKYSTFDILKIILLMSVSVLLYLSIQELRVALGEPLATAQTVPCTTPTPSNPPSATPSATPSPTPATTTPTPTPSGSIFLTEFMACPNSGNEWLELYNASDTTITVNGWHITDAANNKKTLTGSIAPHSFTIFEWSGSLLNNAGDSFTITTDTNQVIAEATYSQCTIGISFVYEDGEWVGAVESPETETMISENTITTATSAAALQKNSDLISDSLQQLSQPQMLGASTQTAQHINYTLPSLKNASLKKSTDTTPANSAPEHKKNTASAVSVILGGLLQLLPASYAIYDTFFKNST